MASLEVLRISTSIIEALWIIIMLALDVLTAITLTSARGGVLVGVVTDDTLATTNYALALLRSASEIPNNILYYKIIYHILYMYYQVDT